MTQPATETTIKRTTPAGIGKIILTTRSSGRHSLSVNNGEQNQYNASSGECNLDDTDTCSICTTPSVPL